MKTINLKVELKKEDIFYLSLYKLANHKKMDKKIFIYWLIWYFFATIFIICSFYFKLYFLAIFTFFLFFVNALLINKRTRKSYYTKLDKKCANIHKNNQELFKNKIEIVFYENYLEVIYLDYITIKSNYEKIKKIIKTEKMILIQPSNELDIIIPINKVDNGDSTISEIANLTNIPVFDNTLWKWDSWKPISFL
ncbi:MAG: hypothetical protein QM535_14725 [Limnohabitans sp.]|nr:hypothetical protein [Limnohabitans sp.]